ncbi:tubulin glycylase 3B isoform X6 [Osmia lignaria lignaria]|uniref:tubulin glycylase 3B isoform X6 n=1 Tax=Osmia lignaria lignaria TaxID=1437193 RepID=UPI001478ECE3|nr:tubulin glycylase 3A-like isoform X6 [Osmia lignaria]
MYFCSPCIRSRVPGCATKLRITVEDLPELCKTDIQPVNERMQFDVSEDEQWSRATADNEWNQQEQFEHFNQVIRELPDRAMDLPIDLRTFHLRRSRDVKIAKEPIPSDTTGNENKIEQSNGKSTALISPEKKESPMNPYNRADWSKMNAKWSIPDTEDNEINSVNSLSQLDCGAFPKSYMDTCSCCPRDIFDKHDTDTITSYKGVTFKDGGCCKLHWTRKERYQNIKTKVGRAIKRHKIFLIRGELPKLKEALEKRGWVQKYEATKTRTLPYGSVASLEARSLGDLTQPDGTLNEKSVVFALLRHKAPDFIWDCRNDFVDWHRGLSSNTILNRYQKPSVYTSKKYHEVANSTLEKLKEVDPQYELNGMRNIWILKPSELCCGTGISISHNLRDIFRRVKSKPKDYFIVQKYIERPLLIHDTKFDIRQWYLVTNTFPMTIWLFKEGLLRFSSKPYTFSTYHEAIHICNTAIQEKYDEERRRRRKRGTSEEVVKTIRDQGWDCDKLNEYLKQTGYEGEPYYEKIYPKMSEAIVLTMLASQEHMDRRRCSFELYGADFVVMEDLSVWLIEINTNPRMHPPSSRITKRLYSNVLESLVKVVMDVPVNAVADTGGFSLVYKQNIPDFRPYLGPCLFVFGKSITLQEHPRKREKKKKGNCSSKQQQQQQQQQQHRAWTAPPMIPRLREPKIVDFIDYLNTARCTAAN